MVRWNVSSKAIEQSFGVEFRIILVQIFVPGATEHDQLCVAFHLLKHGPYILDSSVAVGRTGRDHDWHLGRNLRYHVVGRVLPRIAKMEAAEKSVSLDLLVRSLLSLGASRQDIGAIVGASTVKKAPARSTCKRLVKS